MKRLRYVSQAVNEGRSNGQIYAAYLGIVPREDLVPYVADYLLQLEGISWSLVSAFVGHDVVICVLEDYSKLMVAAIEEAQKD